ncbi:DUF5719 family protein [Microbacterium sp. NPDC058342]|uniref:DUF5719 family protein n=1 Tax=Microbacterium sp. NPDC058342 TaxID=3346454 RepID=UPI00365EBBF8
MKQQTIRFAATGARMAAGAVVATACVLGVAGAVAAPWPQVSSDPASTEITPVPGDTVLVCDGSFRALGRDSSQADLMVSAASPRREISGATDATETAKLEMPEVTGGEGAIALISRVHDRRTPLIAASESVRLSDDDLTGFAAAPCREPALSSWLVGGDVTTGASDIILLTNPGDVTANVDLNVYGESRSASTVVVPAKTQLGLPLASVASGQRSPVVEVVSSGAPVRATLQSALVRTLDAVGIDLQDGVPGLQSDQVILGVQSSPATEGDDSTGMTVRMLSPESDTTATVRVRATGSAEVVDEYSVDLPAAVPAEIALAGVPEGVYDIEVEAGAPIVAGVRQTARAGAAQDFSWALPSPALTAETETMFSVPPGEPATLYLRNAEEEPVSVELSGDEERTVRLAPGESAQVPLDAGGHVLEPTGRVHAAIGMRGEKGSAAIAGWPLWPGAATQQPITVRP